jgi:hypothetical protein
MQSQVDHHDGTASEQGPRSTCAWNAGTRETSAQSRIGMPVAVSAVVTTLLLSTREYSHETVDPARKVRYDESDRPCILSRSAIGTSIPIVLTKPTHFSFHLSSDRELSQHVEQ